MNDKTKQEWLDGMPIDEVFTNDEGFVPVSHQKFLKTTPLTFKAGLYKTYRVFGGREEGGWWYNRAQRVQIYNKEFKTLTGARAWSLDEQVRVDKEMNEPRGYEADIYSVLGEYKFTVEWGKSEELTEFIPLEVPFYH